MIYHLAGKRLRFNLISTVFEMNSLPRFVRLIGFALRSGCQFDKCLI